MSSSRLRYGDMLRVILHGSSSVPGLVERRLRPSFLPTAWSPIFALDRSCGMAATLRVGKRLFNCLA